MKIGIFSWNIGNNVKDYKFDNIIKKIKFKNELPEILVFGFQEVNVNSIEKIKKLLKSKLKNYIFIVSKKSCYGVMSYFTNFGITMLIFKNEGCLNYHITNIKSFNYCNKRLYIL